MTVWMVIVQSVCVKICHNTSFWGTSNKLGRCIVLTKVLQFLMRHKPSDVTLGILKTKWAVHSGKKRISQNLMFDIPFESSF